MNTFNKRPRLRTVRGGVLMGILLPLVSVFLMGTDVNLEVWDEVEPGQGITIENVQEVQIQGNAIPTEQVEQATVIDDQGGEILEVNPNLPQETFKLDDGRKGWKVKLQNPLPLATPAVADGKVYVGGGFGSYEFYAIDAESGKPLWLFHCGDDGPTAAVAEKGRVAFNTESCILYILDGKTGKKLWGKWLGDPLMSQPAIYEDKVLMTFPNQKGGHSLSCMGLEDGKEFWTQDIPGEVISAPVIADGKVYATTLEGSVHCFNIANGAKLFSKEHQATSAPWIWNGEIYVSLREDETQIQGGKEVSVRNEGQGRITSSGIRDNEKLWAMQRADYLNYESTSEYAAAQKSLDASVGFGSAPTSAKLEQGEMNLGVASVSGVWAYQGSRPTIINGQSFTSMGDTLKALDPVSGKVLWKRYIKIKDSPGGRPFSPPSYASGKLYIGAVSGEIICLDAKDGTELWRYNCGETVRFQPAVANGKVYWGTDAGTVFCVDDKDPEATGWFMWGGNAQHNISPLK